MVSSKTRTLGILDEDLEEATVPGETRARGIQRDPAGGVMLYAVCARCHDSHRVLRICSSADRAKVLADLGNKLEVSSVTRDYIAFARAADSDEQRDHWAHEMLQIRANGVTHWFHYVQEVKLS